MRHWKTTVLTTGIILELISLASLAYMVSIIPALDAKAVLFLSAPLTGILFGIFVIRVGARIRRRRRSKRQMSFFHECPDCVL